MSLHISVWSRIDLHIGCQVLSSASRALQLPALQPHIEATEAADAALVDAEAHATIAEVTAAEAAAAFDLSRTQAVDRAQALVKVTAALEAEGVEGADLLVELVHRVWSPADRRMRGVSTLAPLRGLVLALSQAAPSPALAGAARARQRLAEATASFAEALALREETRRAQAAAWAVRQVADETARGALSSLRRAVAWMLGGERTEAYQRWREPAARLGGRSKRTEPGAERGGAEYPNTPGDRSANQCDRDPSPSA